MTTPDAGQRLIEDLRNPDVHFAWDDRLAAAKEIERLRGVEAALVAFDSLLVNLGSALVRALQGDYREIDDMAHGFKIIYVDGAPKVYSPIMAAIAASRSTGAADVGEEHGWVCHCSCHNDPLYCKECDACLCHKIAAHDAALKNLASAITGESI